VNLSTYGKKEKVCATCIFWKGKRNIDFTFIETNNFEGKCSSEEAFYDLRTIEGSSCSNWRGF
jgi:hypothetical protein